MGTPKMVKYKPVPGRINTEYAMVPVPYSHLGNIDFRAK
jgi:hypothetical protein